MQWQHLLVAYPVVTEDGSVLDGIVHHLLLPGAISHKCCSFFCLLFGPFLFPYRLTVLIHSFNLGHIHTLGGCDVCQYGVLGYEVTHHNEATATYVKSTEQGFFHPIGKVFYSLLVTAKLIIIQVVNHDVVRSCLLVSQTTGRLSATTGEECHIGLCYELTFLPVAHSLLLPEVSNDALVELQFRLNVG